MIKNKKNHQIPHTEEWSVWLTPEMLNHLTEPTKFKASKLDAYLNLLEDAAVAKATYESADGQTNSPEAGQLIISITNLAKRWHWSRDTVRKFLDQLEGLGMLSKSRIERRTLVTMTVDCGDAKHSTAYGKTPVPFKMPQHLAVKMDEWLSYIIDESELVNAIEDSYFFRPYKRGYLCGKSNSTAILSDSTTNFEMVCERARNSRSGRFR